ncbi:unnamed protein product [Phytophthora lilii]|uniref:Unnamed protein product n=1 Tax=Phytophthora lilii TaxID=2077276 RepID=A0A9W6U7Q4_9STRA|nr:unnamed protein product [Phytophthora lilii]
MDDVSLKQKQSDDKDLDNLIFNGEKEEATAKENQPQTHDGDSDDGDEKKSTASAKDRSSLSNVLPVDKLKNGANTASKVLGQTFTMFKEKSGAVLEAAKASNAGKTIAGGLSSAATASQEQYGKLKVTEAFKKSSTLASDAYERTSVVASGALEKTLLFRPPEAPIVTGEGHAVLAAWKRGQDAEDPLATFLLAAADGVHQQLGDGSSEFILLVDTAVRHAAEGLRKRQDDRNLVDRAQLSRSFSALKWELQREMQTAQSSLAGLQIAVPIEMDTETMQPSKKFRQASANILISALRGVLGEQSVDFVVEIVLKWVFAAPPRSDRCLLEAADGMDKLLFQRVQHFIKCAPEAIIFMTASSVYSSYVVQRDEFILKKSVVASQPTQILDQCRGAVCFVCFSCSLSLTTGANHVEVATVSEEELFTAQDAAHLFISKFVRCLRDRHNIRLIICTEALDESVIAACTRHGIACVQLAEPEDVEALCMSAGIYALASIFDDIREAQHIGVCTKGVTRVRFQQHACLRLRGLETGSSNQCDEKLQCERSYQGNVVPQLVIHAPTKGVYKQYYSAIVKCLRVLKSWWEPHGPMINTSGDDGKSHATVYGCRGGGATELAIARWLQDRDKVLSSDVMPCDAVMMSLSRHVLASSLIEVVSVLRINLSSTCLSDQAAVGNQRQVLLEAFSSLDLKGRKSQIQGYTLDYSRVLQTLAGPIRIPELVVGDPETYGLVHPWRRIDTLLFLVLQTLEQLFRIDRIFPKTTSTAPASKMH